jgi:hypothetical protein
MNIAESAVSSMNYLFLRFVADKPESGSILIKDELRNFVAAISNVENISSEIRSIIESEMDEGDYFHEMERDNVQFLFQEKTKQLIGEVPDTFIQFYMERFDNIAG